MKLHYRNLVQVMNIKTLLQIITQQSLQPGFFFFLFQILQRLGSVPEEYQSVIVDVINARRSDVHHQLIADTNFISKSTLRDFDWQVKVRPCNKCAF